MRAIVSIVSEQTIPNYLFIREFQSETKLFIFITTQAMEAKGKTDRICSVADIKNENVVKVIFDEDMLNSNLEKLSNINLPCDYEYLVNLTGGTKMMSIATWKFFSSFRRNRFFYVPIGKNIYNEIFDDKQPLQRNFSYNLGCEEYLALHNIKYSSSPPEYNEQTCLNIFDNLIRSNFDLNKLEKNLYPKISEKQSKSSNNVSNKNNNINQTLQRNRQKITKWFEEFIYYKIKNSLKLKNYQILPSCIFFYISEEKKTENYNNDNEIDVFFVYNNKAYICECKLRFATEKTNAAGFYPYIYKLSSLKNRIGINAKATIFTLRDLTKLETSAAKHLRRRCELMGVYYPLFGRKEIVKDFDGHLKKFVS